MSSFPRIGRAAAALFALGSVTFVAPSCSSGSCTRFFGTTIDTSNVSDPCTLTLSAGAPSAQYVFAPPASGAPLCNTALSPTGCTTTEGPPAGSCARSATCVAIDFGGSSADALYQALAGEQVTATLRCGAFSPSVTTSSLYCSYGR